MQLHVVSFDIPHPANYGGVIDVYYKLVALAAKGVKIHLHCFYEDREAAAALRIYCEEVYYYPRKGKLSALPLKLPYIVNSRRSKDLLKRLINMPYPILFEGLHTCYYLAHPDLARRLKMVRMHNVEWDYYFQLSTRETSWTKKQYLLLESQRLQEFEGILTHAQDIFTISPADTEYFKENFQRATYLPPFHPNGNIISMEGKGKYCLYHAKLSVAENHEAAMFLITEVFSNLNIPLIIAGSEPLPELIEHINHHDHITLNHNAGEGEMLDLMRNAHIHVLPTFQASGAKLKLLNALYTGRFCVVTPAMVENTGLEPLCLVADRVDDFRSLIKQLIDIPFPEQEIQRRKELLLTTYDNDLNAQKIYDLIN
ncbi:MAG: glycosyltransferase [Bacteroidota bacterium]